MTADDRPSIAELQRLCRDEGANHDADLASAAPVLLEIAAAALALREQERVAARVRFEAHRQRALTDRGAAEIANADADLIRRQDAYGAALAKVRR